MWLILVKGRANQSTARPVCTARPSVSTARPVYAARPIYPRMDNVRPRGSCSPIKRSYYTKPAFRPRDLKQDVRTFGVQNITTAGTRALVNTGKGKLNTDLKKSRWVWRHKGNYLDHVSKDSRSFMLKKGNQEILLHDHAVVDSGCSSHMTGNKAYLSDYEDFNGGFVLNSGRTKVNTDDHFKVLRQATKRTKAQIQATKRKKAQIQQEEAGLAEAMRLQALQEEEAARQVHLDALLAKRILEEEELSEQQKKRKAEVQEAAQYYTEEDWDTIKAKLKANA
ncbi:hypothetical protein Tco_1450520 [Tanacetum coccineum]